MSRSMVLKFYRKNDFGRCRSCETSSHAAAPAQMGMPADIQYVHSRERLDASYLVGRAQSDTIISASPTTPSMLIPIDSGPMRSSIGFVSIVLKYLNWRSSVYLYKQSQVRSRTGRSQRSGSTKTRKNLVDRYRGDRTLTKELEA